MRLVLDTARLGMRSLSAADATLFCDIFGDADTMRFVGPPLSRERAERSFRRVLSMQDRRPVECLFLVIVEKATQQPIGIGSLQEFDLHRRRVEAGMMLKSGSRGRGFGKEGLAALVTHAFAVFPVDEVWIQHPEQHSSAARVPISLGFARNMDAAACEKESRKCIWSAYRQSWCRNRAFDSCL